MTRIFDPSTARIMIADDDPTSLDLIERMLRRNGYQHIERIPQATRVVPAVRRFRPDLLILDLIMPQLHGFDVLQHLQDCPDAAMPTPIMVITSDTSVESRRKAISLGACDVLTKPFERQELASRVRNHVSRHQSYVHAASSNPVIDQMVSERIQGTMEAQVAIVERLATAAEFHEQAAVLHTRRVGEMSAMLAETLGVEEETVNVIRHAAVLHDVGKVAIPAHILAKPGKLSRPEFDLVKHHTIAGHKILSGSNHPLLQMAAEIALSHHENWDGTGYPYGQKGEQIPLSARIVAVVDVYDALISDRCYKAAWSPLEATREILAQSGKKFDPSVVVAFRKILESGITESDVLEAV